MLLLDKDQGECFNGLGYFQRGLSKEKTVIPLNKPQLPCVIQKVVCLFQHRKSERDKERMKGLLLP